MPMESIYTLPSGSLGQFGRAESLDPLGSPVLCGQVNGVGHIVSVDSIQVVVVNLAVHVPGTVWSEATNLSVALWVVAGC